ncbi:DNA-binding barrel domain superfamily [Sesbania bispinosa]|nr:DNA-binding barrel domain superfamily [Sesbania bispinosa]
MAYINHNACTHLSLGVCTCNETFAYGFKRRWGYSTDLMLYDDPWKIKKVLQDGDLDKSMLLLAKDLAEDLVLSVLGADAQREVGTGGGIQVRIWDIDTKSMYSLVFKRLVYLGSYAFIGNWIQDFVWRRGLKRGDEIGLHWDPYNKHFNFSILQANQDSTRRIHPSKV